MLPEILPPYSVLLFQHSTRDRVEPSVEQITFENADSPLILEVLPGAPSRAATVMRGTTRTSPARTAGGTAHLKTRRTGTPEEESLPNNGQ